MALISIILQEPSLSGFDLEYSVSSLSEHLEPLIEGSPEHEDLQQFFIDL